MCNLGNLHVINMPHQGWYASRAHKENLDHTAHKEHTKKTLTYYLRVRGQGTGYYNETGIFTIRTVWMGENQQTDCLYSAV